MIATSFFEQAHAFFFESPLNFIKLVPIMFSFGFINCFAFDYLYHSKLIMVIPVFCLVSLHFVDMSSESFSKCLMIFSLVQFFLKTGQMILQQKFYLKQSVLNRFLDIFMTQWPLSVKEQVTPRLDFQLLKRVISYGIFAYISFTLYRMTPSYLALIDPTTVYNERGSSNGSDKINNSLSDSANHNYEDNTPNIETLHLALALQLTWLGSFVLYILKFMYECYRFSFLALFGWKFEPCFDDPEWSESLQEYWGKRWNRPINYQLKLFVYKPLRQLKLKPKPRDHRDDGYDKKTPNIQIQNQITISSSNSSNSSKSSNSNSNSSSSSSGNSSSSSGGVGSSSSSGNGSGSGSNNNSSGESNHSNGNDSGSGSGSGSDGSSGSPEEHLVSPFTAQIVTFAVSGFYHGYPVFAALWGTGDALFNGFLMSLYFLSQGLGLHIQNNVYKNYAKHNYIIPSYVKWLSTIILATFPGPFFLFPLKNLLQLEGDITIPHYEFLSLSFWKFYALALAGQLVFFSTARYCYIVCGSKNDRKITSKSKVK